VLERTEVHRALFVLRINTWTYISSFQISTFPRFSFEAKLLIIQKRNLLSSDLQQSFQIILPR
jgi:hypothetical protein